MSLNKYEVELLATVDKHGWHGTHVFDPEGNDPLFSYSTGFTKSLNKPEFVIIGLSKDLMHSMLWGIYEQLEAGAIPEDGMEWQGLLEGFSCVSKRAIHPDLFKEYTTTADWFWKHEGNSGHPDVFQMVWPGAQQGLLPWDENCDPYVISQQPALWSSD